MLKIVMSFAKRTVNLRCLQSLINQFVYFYLVKLKVNSTESNSTYTMESFNQFIIQNYSRSQSQLFQDLWVVWRLEKKTKGFFLDIGASDPVILSNTYLLEKEFGFTGLLIEPNPSLAQKLRVSRTSAVVEKAVSPDGGIKRFQLATQPEFGKLADVSRKNEHKLFTSLGEDINVQCDSLTNILDQNGAPQDIDFMSLDVEGHELLCLSTLDFSRFAPKLICVEHNFRKDRWKIQELLLEKGYVRDPVQPSFVWDDWWIRSDMKIK